MYLKREFQCLNVDLVDHLLNGCFNSLDFIIQRLGKLKLLRLGLVLNTEILLHQIDINNKLLNDIEYLT